MNAIARTCALPEVQASVQQNCHIADALHAGNYTLCVYLLKMREFYRWEQGLPFQHPLGNETVGNWLRQRESLWEELESAEFVPVRVGDAEYDPFESDAINAALEPHGLIYSGGIGAQGKPHFFLGSLHRHHQHHDYTVYIADREYARDLGAPPAMAQGRTIWLRRESLKRFLWEKLEEWRWSRPDNAMARAIACYDFPTDVERALDEMTENELDSALLHEIGEVEAGRRLGPDWESLLAALPRSRIELLLRAVRDHLADSLITLPELLEQEKVASIHFWFANLNGMRQVLWPAIDAAYRQWRVSGEATRLSDAVVAGQRHWPQLTEAVLGLYREKGAASSEEIGRLLENNRL